MNQSWCPASESFFRQRYFFLSYYGPWCLHPSRECLLALDFLLGPNGSEVRKGYSNKKTPPQRVATPRWSEPYSIGGVRGAVAIAIFNPLCAL